MNMFLLLFFALAIMIAECRILTVTFPSARSGKRLLLLLASAVLIFLPPAWQIIRGDRIIDCCCSILAAALTLTALIDCRQKSTAYELYPVLIGLVSVPILVMNLLTQNGQTGKLISSPVIGLLSGLGLAIVASLMECILSKNGTVVLASVSMGAAVGFFAGFPGVLWVIGAGWSLCLCEWVIRAKLLHKERFFSFNGILAFSLVYFLALKSMLFNLV